MTAETVDRGRIRPGDATVRTSNGRPTTPVAVMIAMAVLTRRCSPLRLLQSSDHQRGIAGQSHLSLLEAEATSEAPIASRAAWVMAATRLLVRTLHHARRSKTMAAGEGTKTRTTDASTPSHQWRTTPPGLPWALRAVDAVRGEWPLGPQPADPPLGKTGDSQVLR